MGNPPAPGTKITRPSGTDDTEAVMKFLFDDESFSFEALRTAGFTLYGGADLGEVLATACNIGEGDEASWHRAWKATAQRLQAAGENARAAGYWVSAREALLRASNYYRTAADFLLEKPATDPEMRVLSAGQHDSFAAAAALFDTPVQAVSIPYEGTTLPAYLFLVDDSGAARPTIIYNSGYDSTREESYFVIAAAALRRGYNVLAFDGPGQGAVLREQNLVMRPDWEAVITPVVDYALTRGEIAVGKIVLFGYSLGGYLVARAAAFEHRVAALILDDGIHDFHAALRWQPAAFYRVMDRRRPRRRRGPRADDAHRRQHAAPVGAAQRDVGLRGRLLRRPDPQGRGLHPRRRRPPDHRSHPDHGPGQRPVPQGPAATGPQGPHQC
ncbi:MAG TPA: alpha/beta fold hydrolase [Streptosporangiaceae bacterium]|jgi:pimeloyl-ACP methyl ester carboxylesterase|nr:alpha/beta fold hydrolase [Streptosporangiaceae bacterium]